MLGETQSLLSGSSQSGGVAAAQSDSYTLSSVLGRLGQGGGDGAQCMHARGHGREKRHPGGGMLPMAVSGWALSPTLARP